MLCASDIFLSCVNKLLQTSEAFSSKPSPEGPFLKVVALTCMVPGIACKSEEKGRSE